MTYSPRYIEPLRIKCGRTETQRNNVITEVHKVKEPPTPCGHELDTLRKPVWYDRYMLEGKCTKCGTHRRGWALLNPRHQTCPQCGEGLVITEDGRKVAKGYSPFTAEKYLIKPPTKTPPPQEKAKDSRTKKE